MELLTGSYLAALVQHNPGPLAAQQIDRGPAQIKAPADIKPGRVFRIHDPYEEPKPIAGETFCIALSEPYANMGFLWTRVWEYTLGKTHYSVGQYDLELGSYAVVPYRSYGLERWHPTNWLESFAVSSLPPEVKWQAVSAVMEQREPETSQEDTVASSIVDKALFKQLHNLNSSFDRLVLDRLVERLIVPVNCA